MTHAAPPDAADLGDDRQLAARVAAAEAAILLDQHPDYRVLRRLLPRDSYTETPPGRGLKIGVVADCETTGLDTEDGGDVIIQAALLPFTFHAESGTVYDVLPGYSALEDPGRPLRPEITEITGITDGDLLGQRMDDDAVFKLASSAAIVIAKKAAFDRPMFERRWPFFADLPWACAQEEVPWIRHGYRDRRLGSLLSDVCHVFHEAHDALADCRGALHLLATAKLEGRSALAVMLEHAKRNTWRVRADVPMGYNLVLKARGFQALYRRQQFQYWWRDVTTEEFPGEQDWLVRNCEAAVPVKVKRVSALTRYSHRV